MHNIDIIGKQRSEWITQIASIVQNENLNNPHISINMPDILRAEDMEPIHLVLLACLIEHCVTCGCNSIKLNGSDAARDYIMDSLKFSRYWGEEQTDHIPCADKNILNLWKINNTAIESYLMLVHDYLRRGALKNKDLSAVKSSLIEACYNVADHAWVNSSKPPIGFVFLKYDEQISSLQIAICDFGVGIAHNIKRHFELTFSDKEAIELAMQDRVTTKSLERNQGRGMPNIISPADLFWVISNSGMVSHNQGNFRTFDLPYEFPGTILFCQLALSDLEDEEILPNFEF